MSNIVLKNIDKFYGKNHVLKNLDLTIADGEFMTLLGPSGCGKTTTLRIIAGLEKPQQGTIHMDEREIVNASELFFAPPDKRGLSLVFQSYALWPHMTVFQNVAFSMQVEKRPKAEIQEKVEIALARMRIAEYAERYPSELSGGQQQRVAIARAIVNEPKVLLLDEPLSNLDAKLRVEMRSELKRLHHDLGTTIVYVTHDQVEALTMSTKIAVFFEGELEQVDSPMALYLNPATLRVADFIGNPNINLIDCRAAASPNGMAISSPIGDYAFTPDTFTDSASSSGEFDAVIGIRPEKITVSTQPLEQGVEAKVYISQPAGSETIIHMKINGCDLLAKEIGLKNYLEDQRVWLGICMDNVNVFEKQSGRLVKKAALEE